MRKSTDNDMDVRELIELLAHLEGDIKVATRNFQHGQDRTTLNFVGTREVTFDVVFVNGKEQPVVIIG
jgi:hypothetical protein